jgi:hypothetical protein
MWHRLRLLSPGVILIAFAAAAAWADSPDKPEDFARTYVEAVRSGEPRRLQALLHSKSRQCLTPKTEALFAWKWQRSITRGAPEPYQGSASRLDARIAAGTSQSQFPVAPTHMLQIDFGTAPNTLTTVLLLAFEDGSWRTVEQCPGDAGSTDIR